MVKDLKYYQHLNLKLNTIIGAVFAATAPLIHVYMIQHINTDFFKIINFLDEALVFGIIYMLDKKDENGNPKILRKLRLYFIPIIVTGMVAFIFANLLGLLDVRIRFLMLSTINGVVSYLWKTCMNDLWNNLINGTDLTAWINSCNKYDRIGAAVGATLILFMDLGIELALAMQCAVYIYMGYVDYKIYTGLRSQAYNKKLLESSNSTTYYRNEEE